MSAADENEDAENSLLHSPEMQQTLDLSAVSTVSAAKKGERLEKENCEQENEEIAPEIALPDFMRNCVALDTETEPFDKKRGITPRNARMIGMSFSHDGVNAEYITDKDSWEFRLPEPDQTVILHHAKFDFGVLKREGLSIPSKFEDTLIAAHLLKETGQHGLKQLAKEWLGVKDPLTFEEADKMRLLDPDVFNEYACNDARFTFQLCQKFMPEIDAQGLREVYELEKQILPCVMEMERAGMQLDVPALEELDRSLKDETTRLTAAVFEQAGMEFNWNSLPETAAIIYDKLGVTCPKQTKTGKRSLDSETLKKIEDKHAIVPLLLELRGMDKLASTFTKQLRKKVDATGRIHAEFNQIGAITGRFTCREPNLQQVPARSESAKKLRACFIAPVGKKLVVADWSQMEMRILAHYSKDAELLKAFESDVDCHTLTAQKMFGKKEVTKDERSIAKMINFGIDYGITPLGLYTRLQTQGVSVSEDDCTKFIDTYFATYKGVSQFLKDVEKAVKQRGYVRSILGRRRRVSGINKREIRQAQNFVIQGTAADLAKQALLKLSQRLPTGAQIISMIHDEFVIECDSGLAEDVRQLTVETMSETPTEFKVKMEVEAKVVSRWSDAK